VNLSKEFKIGLLAVASGVVLYTGVNFLKGSDFMSSTNRYFVLYDNVEGLTASNPVMLNGLAIGRVEKIELLQQRNLVCVSLEIDRNVQLGDSSTAILSDGDLLGGKIVVLKVGKLHKLRQEEDTLLSSNEQSITEALKAKALPVLDQLDSTAKELGKVMKSLSKTTAHVNSAVEDFEATSKSLRGIMEDNRASIKGTSQNIHKITGALASAQKDVNEVIGKMNRFGDTLTSLELGKTVDNANKSIESLNTMLTRINKGQGTLGKLAVNDSLYNNLKSTSANLDQLFIDMKANPKRYVHFSIFGKKDKKEQKK
jgi:phospholipid/cholesterol/gamma-HCH transport system substrate-binding protein